MIKNNDKEKSENCEQKTLKCQLIFGGVGVLGGWFSFWCLFYLIAN